MGPHATVTKRKTERSSKRRKKLQEFRPEMKWLESMEANKIVLLICLTFAIAVLREHERLIRVFKRSNSKLSQTDDSCHPSS